MTRALLLIAAWTGRAFTAWLHTLRRPLAAEVAALRERNEKLRAENDLLRARLLRLDPHRRPHFKPWHVFVMDFTQVRSFFRSVIVAAVIDSFSRKVLALAVCDHEPDAAFACRVLQEAIDRYGKPTWVLTDRGTQFTAHRFRSYLRRRGIRRRYAALGEANLSRIDRFWRTMKEEFACGLMLFRPVRSFERDLRAYVRWHGRERPHEGLRLRTPDEVFFGRKPKTPKRIEAGAIVVSFADRDHRLPVLRLRRAG